MKAAEAIVKQFDESPEDPEVHYIDSFSFSFKCIGPIYCWVYLILVKHLSWLWGFFYYSMDNNLYYSLIVRPVRRIFHLCISAGISKFLMKEKPDILVCTHFYMLEQACFMKKSGKLDSTIVCVVTDYMAHNFWIEPLVDMYCVAHEDTKEDLIARGIDREKIIITGIPVDGKFYASTDRLSVSAKHQIKPDLFTVLVVSGGYGVGPIEKIVNALSELKNQAQIFVVCGKNRRLKDKLDQFKMPENVHLKVLGFVDYIDELMGISDVLITKSGGLIVSEAIAKKLPLILISPIPGQEAKNRDFVVQNGIGLEIKAIEKLTALIDGMIINPETVKSYHDKIEHAQDNALIGKIARKIIALPKNA